MEARRCLLDNEEKYSYVVKAEHIKQIQTENGSLTQFIQEECFVTGSQGLRSFHKDFFGRNYRIEGLPFLGFSPDFAKQIESLDIVVEEKAEILLQEKLATTGFLRALSDLSTVRDKLSALQKLKETNENNKTFLSPLIGSAVTASELVIREKLIELYGLEVAENLIAAQSQGASYLSNQIFCGAILPTGLLLRQAAYAEVVLFNEDEFYLKTVNSHSFIFNSHCEKVGIIESPVVVYFKLNQNSLGQWGYEFVEMRTNDKVLYDMYLGHMPSLEEIMSTYALKENEEEMTLENSSSFPDTKSAALITAAVIGGGIATGGIAWAVGVSALGIAATASVGAAAGGALANNVANRFGLFAPPTSTETSTAEIDQPKRIKLSG